jgi:hypothetical protein
MERQKSMSSPLDWVHRTIERAGWQRAGLDRLAQWSQRPGVPSYPTKMTPTHEVPRGTYTVTVVIPCFNYGRFLRGAIASAVAQDGIDVEIVIVDDCSTDDSLAVARRLAEADPRITVIAQPENRGHVRTFNEGLAAATGDFIVRLDADDLLTPGSLTRAVTLFEQFPEVGLVYGHPRHFVEDDVPAAQLGDVSWTVWRGRDWVARRCARGTNCITTPEAVIRASVVARVGGLNPRLRFAQDMEMWLRVAAVSDVARVNDVDQALHRDHARSMSVNEGLQAQARRALALEALRHASYALDRGRYDRDLEQQLIAFAVETDPGVTSTVSWRTHQLRARIGPRLIRWDPIALLRVARVRARDEVAYLQWARMGL